jgi:nucleoside permease NupC
MATRERFMVRGRQVVFGPLQRHSQTFEFAMIVICIICIVVAVIIAKATDWGVTTRP